MKSEIPPSPATPPPPPLSPSPSPPPPPLTKAELEHIYNMILRQQKDNERLWDHVQKLQRDVADQEEEISDLYQLIRPLYLRELLNRAQDKVAKKTAHMTSCETWLDLRSQVRYTDKVMDLIRKHTTLSVDAAALLCFPNKIRDQGNKTAHPRRDSDAIRNAVKRKGDWRLDELYEFVYNERVDQYLPRGSGEERGEKGESS